MLCRNELDFNGLVGLFSTGIIKWHFQLKKKIIK